jgi:ABC-type nickel/cobalt efflux system permease component RcnA
MDPPSTVLCATAAAIAGFHTLLGPDHYLPFVAMSRAGGWSLRKTIVVTVACGIGHVAGSVLLGLAGIALGAALFRLEAVETARGEIAGWLLMGFGLAYTAWGLRSAYRQKPHSHWHVHADGTLHTHGHVHDAVHAHVHTGVAPAPGGGAPRVTPWILFTLFMFGPCEPLIPILMYPAAKGSHAQVIWATVTFASVTIGTMVAAVLLGLRLSQAFRVRRLERFGHSLAGATVLACGLAVTLGM